MNNGKYYINVDETVLRAWTFSYANRPNFIVLFFDDSESKALCDQRNILHRRESRASIGHNRSIFMRVRV